MNKSQNYFVIVHSAELLEASNTKEGLQAHHLQSAQGVGQVLLHLQWTQIPLMT